jgi:hypothetical protein
MRLIILLSFLFCGFMANPDVKESPCFFTESMKWELISYKDLRQQTETTRPWRLEKFFKIILQFDYDEEIGGGTFEGQSLSNVIAGAYSISDLSGDTTGYGISIHRFEDSQMREPAWGLDSMRIAMKTVYGFQCNGDTLLLQYNKGRSAMVFLKTEEVFYDWDEYLREFAGSSRLGGN